MHVDSCRTGKYDRHLLRTTFRESGKVRHKTLGNLSSCSRAEIEAIRWALRNSGQIPPSAPVLRDIRSRQGRSVGAVFLLRTLARRLGIDQALGDSQEGRRALWQVLARVIDQGSRLSAVRLAGSHAACDLLGLEAFTEDHLYTNLDWLSERQPDIEQALFRHLHPSGHCGLFLYDVTSTYLEGLHNELSAFGYNRDGKRGKLQLVVGLLCDGQGRALSVEVFAGNTQDPATVASQIRKVAERFGGGEVTFVGDRGMVKSRQVEDLLDHGFHYITAITKPQIEALLAQHVIELGLFDSSLAEVSDDTGIRYVLRRNPLRADEVRRSRQERLEKVKTLAVQKTRYLQEHPRAQVQVAFRAVEQRARQLKLARFVGVVAQERQIRVQVDEDALAEGSKLDGCYVIKTDLPVTAADTQTVHARYKDLALVEWAFRTSKTVTLDMRPVFVRLESRTRGHAFVVMLAYRLIHHLSQLWHSIELTVEEAIAELASICVIDLIVDGKVMLGQVPEPREMCKKLLDLAEVTLPGVVMARRVPVATRKKLVSERSNR